jgi:hypothetical protein
VINPPPPHKSGPARGWGRERGEEEVEEEAEEEAEVEEGCSRCSVMFSGLNHTTSLASMSDMLP